MRRRSRRSLSILLTVALPCSVHSQLSGRPYCTEADVYGGFPLAPFSPASPRPPPDLTGCVTLDLENAANFSADDAILLAAMLSNRTAAAAASASAAPILSELSIAGTSAGESGASALLGASEYLAALDLSRMHLTAAVFDAMPTGDVLYSAGSLKRLRLSWNRIGDAGAAALASRLSGSWRPEALYLERNQIADNGAIALATAALGGGDQTLAAPA